MDEGGAYALALRVAGIGGYRVLKVRRAWSAVVAWHVEAENRRSGEHLLFLAEDQFDSRLMMEAGQPDTEEITTPHTHERAAATSNS